MGFGYDSHRFVEGRPLILGGQHIPYARGLTGHSDADALTHAVIDALLGAAAAGNIGQLFPDTDPRWANADSLKLLAEAWQPLWERGYRVGNIDATIVAEAPKLGPYLGAMGATLARVLDIDPARVSVKAKTNEGMGFVGRGEGVAVLAVAALEAS